MRILDEGQIDWGELLWKYFRIERFVSAIETGEIYFAAATQFLDQFEGAVAVQMGQPEPDARYSEMEFSERAFSELKRLTKISCWHRAAYESDAMWKLYAGDNKGVAICTTPDRMRAAFKPYRIREDYGHEDLWAGNVEYIDLTQVRLKRASMLNRFFYKHRAFEWEREFRLAISLRSAEEFGVRVPEGGIVVSVDLDVLIDKIVIGSTTRPEDREIILSHVERVGLSDRLRYSTLLGRPRYV